MYSDVYLSVHAAVQTERLIILYCIIWITYRCVRPTYIYDINVTTIVCRLVIGMAWTNEIMIHGSLTPATEYYTFVPGRELCRPQRYLCTKYIVSYFSVFYFVLTLVGTSMCRRDRINRNRIRGYPPVECWVDYVGCGIVYEWKKKRKYNKNF